MVRTRPILLFVAAVFAFLLATCSVSAQVDQAFETGMNPYRSYQTGNIDTISLWGRQLNVDIPIISYPQRGGKLQLNFVLHYANLGEWYDTDCSSSPCSYSASGNYPISGFGVIQAGAIVSGGGTCGTYPANNQDELCNYTAYLADGSTSSLLPTNRTTWKSPDLQGIQLSNFTENQYSPSALLTDRNGISYGGSLAPPGNLLPLSSYAFSATPPGLAQDANGNQISFQAYGSGLNPGIGWTDTMGRNIPLPVAMTPSMVASTCPQTPLVPLVPDTGFVWNFPGVNGGTYAVTFCYAEVAYHIVNAPGYLTSGNLDELQSVLLPNGTKWTFQYSTDGNVDLTQITFPTGGALSYTFNPTNNYPDGCAVHSYTNTRAVVTRTLTANNSDSPSGKWTYGTASGGRVIVTDPLSNDTAHTFTDLNLNSCPFYETTTQYYQGSYTAGTLLKTVKTAFTPLSTGSNSGQPGTINTVWPNNQENQVSVGYDSAVVFYPPVFVISTGNLGNGGNATTSSYGLTLSKKEYDYGTSPNPGSLLRTTTTTYEALTSTNASYYLANNLLTLPASVVVTGSGPGSTTTNSYDGAALQASNISTQHNSSPPSGTYRGNLTNVANYLNTTGANLNTATTFYDTGMPYVVKDPNLNSTTYGYSSTYAGALVTSVENAKNQTTTSTYDFNTGLQTSSTDANGLITNYTFDNMLRPAGSTYPNGGSETITRQESSLPFSASLTRKITSNLNYSETNVFDGLGRVSQNQITDAQGNIYKDTTYDSDGHISTVSNPYRSKSDTTYGITTYQYDSLNRPTLVIPPDGTVSSNNVPTSYCGGSILTSDQAGHWRRTKMDGLGRLIEADEPNSLTATVNVCPGTGEPIWATTYGYDVLDDLTSVTQTGPRNRALVYDSLKRLTSATNPESGTILYTYDSNGNVLTKTDAAGRTETHTYDALNRMLTQTPTPSDNSSRSLQYDTSTCLGVSRCANIGYETLGQDFHGSNQISYDPLDRQFSVSRNTVGVVKTTTYTFNYDGSLASVLYPSGRTVTYGTDNVERPSNAQDVANGITYISGTCNTGGGFGACYAPQGSITANSYGAATGSYVAYEATFNNRLQLAATNTFVEGGSSLNRLTYNYNDSNAHNNGNLISVANYNDSTRSQQFTYDQVNRIITAETNSTYATSPAHCWGEAYVYDNAANGQFGNLTNINVASTAYNGCTQESLSMTATSKNQFTSFTYDASGNVTNDGHYSYNWYADGHMGGVNGVSYLYDVNDNRFQKGGNVVKWYWYGLGSQPLDESDASGNITDEYVYFGNQAVAHRVVSSNTVYFYSQDLIGSSRALFTSAGTLCYDADFYPFGGERAYTNTCAQNYKFTGQERDSESNLDNFEARYVASADGRFMSPDPSGLAFADPTNPQTLNLYSYVRNNPLVLVDPDGLSTCDAGDEPTCTPGALTSFGGPFFYDPTANNSQDPPPPPGPPIISDTWHPFNRKGSSSDRHQDGYCATSNPICYLLLGLFYRMAPSANPRMVALKQQTSPPKSPSGGPPKATPANEPAPILNGEKPWNKMTKWEKLLKVLKVATSNADESIHINVIIKVTSDCQDIAVTTPGSPGCT